MPFESVVSEAVKRKPWLSLSGTPVLMKPLRYGRREDLASTWMNSLIESMLTMSSFAAKTLIGVQEI